MRNLGLAKKALLLALCAALAVPAAGMGWAPLTAEAAQPVESTEENDTAKTGTDGQGDAGVDNEENPDSDKIADAAYKQKAIQNIDQYYIIIQNEIKSAGNQEQAEAAIKQAKDTINNHELSQGMVDRAVTNIQTT